MATRTEPDIEFLVADEQNFWLGPRFILMDERAGGGGVSEREHELRSVGAHVF